MFAGYTGNLAVINNIIRDTPVTKSASGTPSPDQGGIDLERDTLNTRIFGNIISGNQYGVECMMHGLDDGPCNFEIRDNGFIGNRISAFYVHGTKIHAGRPGVDASATSPFKNNFYYGLLGAPFKPVFTREPNAYVSGGELDAEKYPSMRGKNYPETNPETFIWNKYIQFENNTVLSVPEKFYAASRDFGAPGSVWQYWFRQGSADWTPLTVKGNETGLRSRWTTGISGSKAYVSRFELRPELNRHVALVWKAPRTGRVAIRGRANMAEPAARNDARPLSVDGKKPVSDSFDGVRVRIAKMTSMKPTSSTPVWPLGCSDMAKCYGYVSYAADTTRWGIPTDPASEVEVSEGNFIVFQVESNNTDIGDATSWAPMIAYMD